MAILLAEAAFGLAVPVDVTFDEPAPGVAGVSVAVSVGFAVVEESG
ncbi:hypothetical protein [Mycolicibacterium sphagni]|nr:hypothetical protein [Mycolicibacterium sphagni]MCV7179994.1 hypothetical protein [Mycolicibacterium sphagni]